MPIQPGDGAGVSQPDRLLSVVEAANFFNRSVWWVLAHTSGKKKPILPFIRIGKRGPIQFRMSDLQAFLDGCTR